MPCRVRSSVSRLCRASSWCQSNARTALLVSPLFVDSVQELGFIIVASKISATAVSLIAGGGCGGRSFETGDLSAADRTPDRRRASPSRQHAPPRPSPTTAELRFSRRDPRRFAPSSTAKRIFRRDVSTVRIFLTPGPFVRKRRSPGRGRQCKSWRRRRALWLSEIPRWPRRSSSVQYRSVPFDIAPGQNRRSAPAPYCTGLTRRQLGDRNSSGEPATYS